MQKEKGWKKNVKKGSSLILPFYLSFFTFLTTSKSSYFRSKD